jgi:hypothetical protein
MTRTSGIAGRLDRSAFDHQHGRALWRPRFVHYAFWYRESVVWPEFDSQAPFQIDKETAMNNVEEFILAVVLVPVEFAFYDTQPDDAVIDPAKCPIGLTLG